MAAQIAESLSPGHQAGVALDEALGHLFRRETDRFIRATIGKQSLDVGADRIARTCHAALTILVELRELTGEPIPLALEPGAPAGAAGVEDCETSTTMGYTDAEAPRSAP